MKILYLSTNFEMKVKVSDSEWMRYKIQNLKQRYDFLLQKLLFGEISLVNFVILPIGAIIFGSVYFIWVRKENKDSWNIKKNSYTEKSWYVVQDLISKILPFNRKLMLQSKNINLVLLLSSFEPFRFWVKL